MSLVASPMSPDNQCPGDEPVSWSRAFRNPRPLAIGSASHYAQEHGLTLDFYTESSKRAAAHLISLKGDSQHAKGRELTSYSHLAQCTIPTPGISDSWLDTEPSVQYFQQLLSALDDPCLQSVGILEPRHRVAKEARCEIPVLRSDNNLDLLGLVCDIYNRQAVPLAETSMPLVEPDASGDEGLHFPCWSDQLTKHFDNHLPKEVLQNGEASPQAEDAGFYGTADVGKPDRKAISGLIETEFTVYKQSRVRTRIAFGPRGRA
ncbi:hypothetical protein IMZ48_45725 [Candidatus Bathyarchaeota archaeon]|nr:hypothetical protein [Candidatus Bathyarchaeota archaeon]